MKLVSFNNLGGLMLSLMLSLSSLDVEYKRLLGILLRFTSKLSFASVCKSDDTSQIFNFLLAFSKSSIVMYRELI